MRELSLPLDDDSVEQNAAADVLIGSDPFWECLTRKIRKLNNKLTAIETVFGSAVQAPTVSKCKAVKCAQAVVLRAAVTDQQAEPILRLFWELEGVGVSDALEKFMKVHSNEKFTKDIKSVDGHYEVMLPWRENVALADNRSVAERQFRLLSKRLVRSPELMCEYGAGMQRLLSEGIAEMTTDETANESQPVYYMPHQPVLRQWSSTSLRIVSDASSHGIDAKSLVKSVVHACVVRRRCSATAIKASMGLLPPDRTTQADPFDVVDFEPRVPC